MENKSENNGQAEVSKSKKQITINIKPTKSKLILSIVFFVILAFIINVPVEKLSWSGLPASLDAPISEMLESNEYHEPSHLSSVSSLCRSLKSEIYLTYK